MQPAEPPFHVMARLRHRFYQPWGQGCPMASRRSSQRDFGLFINEQERAEPLFTPKCRGGSPQPQRQPAPRSALGGTGSPKLLWSPRGPPVPTAARGKQGRSRSGTAKPKGSSHTQQSTHTATPSLRAQAAGGRGCLPKKTCSTAENKAASLPTVSAPLSLMPAQGPRVCLGSDRDFVQVASNKWKQKHEERRKD